MPTPPNPNDPNSQAIRPDQLVEQLFNAVLMQHKDVREAANQVIDFLTKAVIYAVVQSKGDPIVFLTETLILMVASSTTGDEPARKELLRYISDTIASAVASVPVVQPSAQPTTAAPR